MNKNDIITLEISDVSSEGSGIGKHEGMAVFVPNTAVGDRILARILKVKSKYAFAKVEEILDSSPQRVTVDCASFARCGGCVFRHINYKSECQLKENRVMQTMQRIGKTSLAPKPIICDKEATRYRNKAMYPIASDGEIGFFSHHSHRVIPCGDCPLHPTEFYVAGKAFTDFIKRRNVSIYCEENHSGLLRHFYIRQGKETKEIMVCIVVNGQSIPHQDELINDLKHALGNNLKSVVLNVNTKKSNVVLAEQNILLYGQEYIHDILCGVNVRISPHSFYQVNHDMAERLYEKAAEYASPKGKNVLDLYCGAGTIGLSMADDAKSIIGVEIIEAAVRDANINAKENGIANARFICGDAAKAALQLKKEKTKADVVILDPPRKGCEESLLKTVSFDFAPERIVYVSCDVATLARDTAILENSGYKLVEYTPVDLFPRTAHVETVALFIKGE